jgi:hypothetical protein
MQVAFSGIHPPNLLAHICCAFHFHRGQHAEANARVQAR